MADEGGCPVQYVPLTIIQQLGFSNLRSARAEFYRRVRVRPSSLVLSCHRVNTRLSGHVTDDQYSCCTI